MHSSLRVLVLAQYFPPDMSGSGARAVNVVKGLLSKGCKVTVVAAFPHYPLGEIPSEYDHKAITFEKAGKARVLRVWIPALPHNSILNRFILNICFVISSSFALPFVGYYDVVWAANPNLLCFYSAVVYGFARGKPIVRNVDDLWPEVFYELGIVRSKMMQMILNSLAWLSYVVPVAITPISDGYKRRIVEKYDIFAKKIHVIEVGFGGVGPLKMSENANSHFIVMYSGILGQGYDFEVVLEAARYLAEYPDIVFMIRGVGELAPRLKKRVEELGLKNVVLDTNFLPRKELSALLSSADVFLLPMCPSTIVDEGLPAKVFEYQAHGKPVVCVSSGESARYVEATESGLVVKPRDAYGLAKAVVRLYQDRRLASKLGRNGWRHVSMKMTATSIGERMYEVLASVARG